MMSVDGPAAKLHLLDQRRRPAPGWRRRIRGWRGSCGCPRPCGRRRPAPTGGPPPSIGMTCDLPWQSGGHFQRRAVLRRWRWRPPSGPRSTERGMAAPFRSVTKVLPSQYQRWSASCPHIITAERSLPATATLRLPGWTLLQQVAQRRHAQMVGRDGVGGRGAAGDPLVLGAIDALVAARLRLVEPDNWR